MVETEATKEINNIDFLEEISNFIFTSKYARFNEKKKRRETLPETVDRVCKMHLEKYSFLGAEDIEKIKWAFELVKQKRVVPSMRSMQFGGKAVFAHNARMFNCSVRHIDSIRSFAESFYLLLAGCGVGFGLTKKVIDLLPNLASAKDKTGSVLTYVIEDTIEGWADSLEILLMSYHKNTPFTGRKIVFDFSKIRPKGSPLKTGGGKAPGPDGLKQSLGKIKELLDHAIEVEKISKLRPIHVYDILMHASDAVISGGIRRSACIAIFSYDDDEMMKAKTNFYVSSYRRFEKINNNFWEGTVVVNKKKYEVTISDHEYTETLKKQNEIGWWHIEPQRARSNNSVLLLRNETTKEMFEEIIEKTKQFGEPGFIFADDELTAANPCVEIGFIPKTKDGRFGVQFCNLTEINGAKVKTIEEWKEAAEAATIIGTLQAGYTSFPYLSSAAEELTKEEALLGVSITGWFDNPELLFDEQNQYMMSKLTVKINEEWAKKIGINKAARITCTKPSGTASIFLGSSSGIHPHHDKIYFRRVQVNKTDNVLQFFKMFNPHAVEESVWSATNSDDVITFPIVVDDKAMVKDDLTAIQHLNYIRKAQENWVLPGGENNKKNVTHNISCTVEVDTDEWEEVVNYLYENKQYFAAVSLLPKIGDQLYRQAPLQRVYEEDIEKWNDLVKNWNKIDYSKFEETEDQTSLMDTIACGSQGCDIFVTSEKMTS